MEIKDAKYIISKLNNFTEPLENKELCKVVNYFIFGLMVEEEKDKNSIYLIEDILGQEVFDSWVEYLKTGKETIHSGLMNMTRVHLLQIAFDRFKKII